MPSLNLAYQRLYNQHLIGPKFETAAEVVAHFGAVQAQDYAGAKWAVAQRTTGLTDADLDRAVADGSILRTHVLRPTWHFVTPADIRWLLALTAPRIKAACAYQWRRLELNDAVFKRSHTVLIKILRDGPRPRTQVAEALKQAHVIKDGEQRLSHILMQAELEGLICSGGRHGKQFTYALLEERASNSQPLSRDEALAALTLRYFTGHGPATAHDFAWWSGLTVTDVRRGIESVKPRLDSETIGEQTYWWSALTAARTTAIPALLLPNYDEYIVGYTDRGAVQAAVSADKLDARNNVLFMNTVLMHGRIVGTWQRSVQKNAVALELKPFAALRKNQQRAIAQAVERYSAFLGLPVRWA